MAAMRAHYEFKRAEAYKKELIKHKIAIPKTESLKQVAKEWGIDGVK